MPAVKGRRGEGGTPLILAALASRVTRTGASVFAWVVADTAVANHRDFILQATG